MDVLNNNVGCAVNRYALAPEDTVATNTDNGLVAPNANAPTTGHVPCSLDCSFVIITVVFDRVLTPGVGATAFHSTADVPSLLTL